MGYFYLNPNFVTYVEAEFECIKKLIEICKKEQQLKI